MLVDNIFSLQNNIMLKSTNPFAVSCLNYFSEVPTIFRDLQSRFLAARLGLGKTMVIPPTVFFDFNDFFQEERLN